MNSDSPITPAPATPVGPRESRRSVASIIIGFVLGVLSWLAVLIPQRDYGQVVPLIFNCFALPVIAIILAIIPTTRRFGLGLLIAASLGWLVLGAICGAASL